jgi:sugar lactone lactonase YvrE
MRRFALALGLLSLLPGMALAAAGAGDDVADRVLGQIDLLHIQANFVDGRGFNTPMGVAVDRSVSPNRVYVADAGNQRVLGWSDVEAFLARRPADLVLGQKDVYGLIDPPPPGCPSVTPAADNFCWPQSLAVDRAGNLYVADFYNTRVLEFDRPFESDRTADRVFGPPDFTSRGQNFLPNGLALDPAGNLWVVISRGFLSDQIVRFDRPLTGDPGVDGRLTIGRGCGLDGLAFDRDGRLYTDCPRRSTLFVYEPPFADNEPPARRIPGIWTESLAVDDQGFLYWGPQSSCLQRALTPLGPLPGPGQCWADHSAGDGGMAFDAAGRLLLVSGYHSILVLPRGGGTPRVVGQPNALVAENYPSPNRVDRIGLSTPRAVAVDRSVTPNRLYVLDAGNHRVLGWRDAAGFANAQPADLVIGQPSPFGFDCLGGRAGMCIAFPFGGNVHEALGLAVDAHGNLYVSDTENNRVLELDSPFTTDTLADRVFGQPSFDKTDCGSFRTGLCEPGPLAVGADGALFVADLLNNRVVVYRHPLDSPAQSDLVVGRPGCDETPGPANLCFSVPTCSFPSCDEIFFVTNAGLALDAAGNLWVSDSVRHRVLKFTDPLRSDQRADLVLAGSAPGADGDCFPQASAGVLCDPGALAVSPSGTLFVSDSKAVLEIPTANPTLPAGHVFTLDPTGIVSTPAPGLAFDDLGNLYVADQGGNRLLAFDRPES